MKPVLGRVLQLRPVSYLYNDQPENPTNSLGFIAQEAQQLFPEIVVEGEDGKLGMTYAQTGVIALKAIQEQQQIIEQYEDRVTRLEQEVEELKKLIKKH